MNLSCSFLSKMTYQTTTIDKKSLNKIMSTKVVDELLIYKPFMRLHNINDSDDIEINEIKLSKIHKDKSEEYKIEIILQTSSKINLKEKISDYSIQLTIMDEKHVLFDDVFKKSKCKITSGKKKNQYKISKEVSFVIFNTSFSAFKSRFDNNQYTLFSTEFNIIKKDKEKKGK